MNFLILICFLITFIGSAFTDCSCGVKREPRIVGGEESGINEYPFMAGIVSLKAIEEKQFEQYIRCGGAIIANQYILTAADCIYGNKKGYLGVLVGGHDLRTEEEAPAVVHKISDFIIHPQFNRTTYVNDIAVIKTLKKISFSIYVNPVCLPFSLKDTRLTDEKVTLLGWGHNEFSGTKSDVLKKVDVKVVDTKQCASALKGYEIIKEAHLCAYGDAKDFCTYDKGGPIIFQDPLTRRLVLVGIMSSGIGCASRFPSVNTRVSSYLSWIEEVTPDATYCN